MVALQTPQADIGMIAPDFQLNATDGALYTPDNAKGTNGLLVMFICNHCPFVKAILDKIIRDTSEIKSYGINSIAIMSNDTTIYPEDSFEKMTIIANQKQFPFPYAIDENQDVAKAYGAVCTPDFFVFNHALELQYRGRLDSAGTQQIDNAPRELFNAMKLISQTTKGPNKQLASIGCSIKWQKIS